jgi:hypothetical protein
MTLIVAMALSALAAEIVIRALKTMSGSSLFSVE